MRSPHRSPARPSIARTALAALVAASACVAAAAPSYAQADDGLDRLDPNRAERIQPPRLTVPQPAAFLFASFDQNGDFLMDAEELSAGLDRAFTTLDEDGDDEVSMIAYSDWAEVALTGRYVRPNGPGIDADLSGSVTRAEFTAAFEQLAANYGLSNGPLPFSALLREIQPRGDRDRERANLQRLERARR